MSDQLLYRTDICLIDRGQTFPPEKHSLDLLNGVAVASELTVGVIECTPDLEAISHLVRPEERGTQPQIVGRQGNAETKHRQTNHAMKAQRMELAKPVQCLQTQVIYQGRSIQRRRVLRVHHTTNICQSQIDGNRGLLCVALLTFGENSTPPSCVL